MKISKVITERGYTIAQVAEMLGKSRISVAKTITNNPTVETLRKIAEVIGCNITDFFEDEVSAAYLAQKTPITAFVDYGGEVYRASSVDELQAIVEFLRAKQIEI